MEKNIKPDNDFAKQYPKTPRGFFKRFLFWITILCSLSAIGLMIIYPYNEVRNIVLPTLGVAIIASLGRMRMNKQDKKSGTN
jgi:hypothetical protein